MCHQLSHFENIHSESRSFSAAAFAYSLPSTLFLWSLIALVIAGLHLANVFMGLWVAVGLTIGGLVFFLAFQYAVSDRSVSLPSFSWVRRRISDDVKV